MNLRLERIWRFPSNRRAYERVDPTPYPVELERIN